MPYVPANGDGPTEAPADFTPMDYRLLNIATVFESITRADPADAAQAAHQAAIDTGEEGLLPLLMTTHALFKNCEAAAAMRVALNGETTAAGREQVAVDIAFDVVKGHSLLANCLMQGSRFTSAAMTAMSKACDPMAAGDAGAVVITRRAALSRLALIGLFGARTGAELADNPASFAAMVAAACAKTADGTQAAGLERRAAVDYAAVVYSMCVIGPGEVSVRKSNARLARTELVDAAQFWARCTSARSA